MKIAVVAANGKAGQLIVKEALAQGLDVTAIVRHTNHSLAQKVIEKDLFDLTRDDLAGFDAVVDAFGAWTPETLPLHSSILEASLRYLEWYEGPSPCCRRCWKPLHG